MSKALERFKKQREEKARKLAEREERKKQREQEKKEVKRRKHKKIMRHKANQRYYKKKRKAILKERFEKGDVYAYHLVLIMRNNRVVDRIGGAWWRSTAYELYNNAIEKNRQEVKYPKLITEQWRNSPKRHIQKDKYEIMIIQKIKDDESNISHFRDEYGRLVENVIVDDRGAHVIVDKDSWYVPESFKVYGYHPVKDRKDFDFILNELVLSKEKHQDIRRVFVYLNKVIIQYDLDFDFVTCKTKDEAQRLYDTLEKYSNGADYVFFTGTLRTAEQSTAMLNKLEEKTGWSRTVLGLCNTI